MACAGPAVQFPVLEITTEKGYDAISVVDETKLHKLCRVHFSGGSYTEYKMKRKGICVKVGERYDYWIQTSKFMSGMVGEQRRAFTESRRKLKKIIELRSLRIQTT